VAGQVKRVSAPPADIVGAMSFWSATRWRQHLVLAHPTDRAVLLREESPGWALPVLEMNAAHPGDAAMIASGVRERFGVDVGVLGCLHHDFDRVTRVGEWVRELENHSPLWRPTPPARWITADDLGSLTLAWPGHRRLLTAWLAGHSPARAPWEGRGWLHRAVGWSQSELWRHGLGTIEHVAQVRAWEFSTVLRLTAGARRFFFKAVPAGREREMRVTRRVAERLPHLVAPMIASDVEQGWMLMAGVEGPSLETTGDVRRWEAAARAYAGLQIDWVDHATGLLTLGVHDIRPSRLAAEIDACLTDGPALSPGLRRDLRPPEIQALRTLSPVLANACTELEAGGIPNTLDHGDLWASNVIDTADGPVIIDWEDACFSHPFFGLWYLLMSAEDRVDDLARAQSRIRDAYLEPWTRYASPERLRGTFDLAQRLAPLCFAITFRLDVLPMLHASWELREFVPFFLRRLITAWAGQTG
jgi:hypothetical protein